VNKRQRDEEYPKIYKKQHGEYCIGCGAVPYPSMAKFPQESPNKKLKPFYIISKETKEYLPLQIDHIDNDPTNTTIENEQFMCAKCNNHKKPRGKSMNTNRPKTPEMERGDMQEDSWRSWLNGQVTGEKDFIRDDDAIDGGAEYLTNFSDGKTISPDTTRKYLKKVTSSTGMYYWHKGFVGLKSQRVKLDDYISQVEGKKQKKINKLEELDEAYQKDFGSKNIDDEF